MSWTEINQEALRHMPMQQNRSFRVLFPDVHFQLTSRPYAMMTNFSPCQYNNCILTHNMSERPQSDALIITGRRIGYYKTPFPRTHEQIWIFHQIESPQHYDGQGTEWRTDPGWRSGFNWSMTYDYINTDVHFPYGEIIKKQVITSRNYTEIALGKKRDALLVTSHCGNSAQREIYAKRLQKYITVDIFGGCGQKWNCGHLYVHDSCFDILNTTYRYFLAFENSLCRSYFTEKLFENFNYDVLIVTRGGEFGQATKLFPKGSVISTDSFENADALGKYLSDISASVQTYASLLQAKDQYEAKSYKATYQNALCQICEMLNNQDKYRRHIPDTYNWTYSPQPCRKPTDLP
ncbi:hypothetical protein DPMN_001345 [Dreissena polymorpha]|uniref:Fucosyltransferase n=2 Tax=Dreissena polymorpha TaxID=45954 RepID=A0A9D4MH43_DREPO|nr:hypothetical protein DPMN_001345 [Dreissena polymorpha]